MTSLKKNDVALCPLEKTILKNGENMYGLIFHPDYTHERKTFVGQ